MRALIRATHDLDRYDPAEDAAAWDEAQARLTGAAGGGYGADTDADSAGRSGLTRG